MSNDASRRTPRCSRRGVCHLITQDEIKRLKTNPRQLSWKDVIPEKGLAVPVTSIELKSGYLVSYTIDTIFVNEPNVKLKHVTVTAEKFEPDPADMDKIAHSILGDCFRPPAEWTFPGDKAHYLQITGMDDKDLEGFREAGIEAGVAVIEVENKKEDNNGRPRIKRTGKTEQSSKHD